jgi:hydrogenase small subunit
MAGIIVHVVAFGKLPELDSSRKTKAFYSKRVHDSCYRRPYFDAGLFVESFDDENAKKGYCLYKVGCKGPSTYNTCGNMKWNGGISYPIQSGHGCLGCSAPNFWDADSFYSRDLNILGGKVEESSDTIGKIALGGVVALVIHGGF